MANPQVEDGHTDIAHEIVEAIARTNFTAYETRLLMALFRKTYGWHKKEDAISLSQFAEITKIPSQHCSRTLQRLESRNIIAISRNGSSNKYRFQKDYEQWDKLHIPDTVVPNEVVPIDVVPEPVLPNEDSGTTQRGNQVVPNEVVTNNNTKETIQKKDIYSLFKFWNSKKIITHTKLTDKMQRKYSTALNDYSLDDIKKAIKNYSEVILHPEKYYFDHKWTFDDFLQRGLTKFTDNANPLTNFLKDKNNNKQSDSSGKYDHLVSQ